jgi:hypothetical protein
MRYRSLIDNGTLELSDNAFKVDATEEALLGAVVLLNS